MKRKTLSKLLDEWQVHGPGQWENKRGPLDFYAVSNEGGIIAYFQHEQDAFAFRLDKINSILNR